MTNKILIYGANGYTGKLISQEAYKQKINVHLAGRNKSVIQEIAKQTGFDYSIVSLEEKDKLRNLLQSFHTVIHCAGPFTETAKQMVEACIETKTNYLDITGEIWAFEEVMSYSNKASKAEIKLISGVGFDVVPTDCLAAMLKDRMPDANSIEMAFVGDKTAMSRGTAVTMAKNISKGGFIRQSGKIKNVPLAYSVKEIDFPHKKRTVMSIPWGDLMTTYHQTEIPNIIIYSGANKKLIKRIKRWRVFKFLLGISWIQKRVRTKIEQSITGPDQDSLKTGRTYIVGTVKNNKDETLTLKMITPEAYKLTALTALEAAKRLINDNYKGKTGYFTPAQAFDKDFILSFEGVKLIE